MSPISVVSVGVMPRGTTISRGYGKRVLSPPQMRMLIELLPYYAPKLTAVAVGWQKGEDFYSRLDRAVEASERAKLIEAKVIENTKED